MVRFEIDFEKVVEAIDYLARLQPGITQYYVEKVIFFADKEHLLDYGRPITGDRFVAMEYGPVPSAIRDLLRGDPAYPDEVLQNLWSRVNIQQEGNLKRVHSAGREDFHALSGSDLEYLQNALSKYGKMSFNKLKELSHNDPAYEDAWMKPGNANEMDITLWLDDLGNPALAKAQLEETALFSRRKG